MFARKVIEKKEQLTKYNFIIYKREYKRALHIIELLEYCVCGCVKLEMKMSKRVGENPYL